MRAEPAELIYWGRRAKRSFISSQRAIKSVKRSLLLYRSATTHYDFLRGTYWTNWRYTQRRTGCQCRQFVADLITSEWLHFFNSPVESSTKILSAFLEFLHVCSHLYDSFSKGFTLIQSSQWVNTRYMYGIFQLYSVNARVSLPF